MKPKKCPTCGTSFTAYGIQKYCGIKCVPVKPNKPVKIKQVSDKLKVQLKEYTKVRKVYLSEIDCCEVCNSPATEIHHKSGRGVHLCNTDLFLAVCRVCHARIENNPIWAKEHNYSIDRVT